ncbi:hypothetical protein J9O71_004517 [Salmonella enterica]|nr:hypothetical protein [Salmonella enterica]
MSKVGGGYGQLAGAQCPGKIRFKPSDTGPGGMKCAASLSKGSSGAAVRCWLFRHKPALRVLRS